MSVPSTIAAAKWQQTINDYKKKGFWVVGLLLVGFISYFYYTFLHKEVAGVLWFVGGFIILYYYWVKWFVIPQLPDPDFNPSSLACPDYLSVVPNDSGLYTPTSPTQYFCVDYIGVSRNGGLKKTRPEDLAQDINDPAYTFSIDPTVDFVDSNSKNAFLQRLLNAGLSYNSVGDSSYPNLDMVGSALPSYGNSDVVPSIPGGLISMSGTTGST